MDASTKHEPSTSRNNGSEEVALHRSGGTNLTANDVSVGGDISGRDKIAAGGDIAGHDKIAGDVVHGPKIHVKLPKVGIAILLLLVIAIVAMILILSNTGRGDTIYVAGTQFNGEVAFNNVTIILDQAEQVSGQHVPDSIVEMLRQAMAFVESREFDKAIPLLESVVEEVPLPGLYNNLGAAYLAIGDQERAISYFAKATDNEATRFNLGQLPPSPVQGAQVVNFSSQGCFASWILDGKPDFGWCSADGNFPQILVVELPGEFLVSKFSFDNTSTGETDQDARDVQVYISRKAEDLDYEEIGAYSLNKGEISQGFELTTPVLARWVKLVILSNHGNPRRTRLMEFRIFGMPAGTE
ncbi:MAG TPA: discoidin domain-containing protein [Pyrinomonadaceae bacterium]|nr:discoidin domain-containing protein [Pyrinomonadaceae bacterium]